MNFLYALLGDAMLFSAVAWFTGYGAIGPVLGLRLPVAAKLRLFGEVFLIALALLYVLIKLDDLLGWITNPPMEGSPAPHRLLGIGILLVVGHVYTRRRSQSLASQTNDDNPPGPMP